MHRKLFILVILISSFKISLSQYIIKEGKGIDSLTLGIKETKVINILGNKFKRKPIDTTDYILDYYNKPISVIFDKDSIVYGIEVKLNYTLNIKTSKGLKLKSRVTIKDIESIYGEDWWTTKESNEIEYDMGIVFELRQDTLSKIIIQASDLDSGNDYSFYEYINGIYIPENLSQCFKQLDNMLGDNNIHEIKSKSETEFLTNSHFNIGLWIRNNWGLWQGSRLYYYFETKGISEPDNISSIILTSYYRNIKGHKIKLEEQINKLKKAP